MAQLIYLAALVAVASGAAVNQLDGRTHTTTRLPAQYAWLQPEIDEWQRLGKPLELPFHHVADVQATGKLVEMPVNQPGLFGPTNYEKNVFYYLYTRDNREGTHVTKNVNEFLAAGWNASRPTKVIIHGFTNNIRSAIFTELVPALLDNGDYNVIGVDWGKLCKSPWYVSARSNVGPVGKQVASLVDFLVENGQLQTKDLHVMGHSLGAHVAGNVGKHVTKGDVERITALDPAMPLFLVIKNDRLHKNDAKFVDVVHTCAGLLALPDEMGDVDFYPNGGTLPQPGCGLDIVGSCSHGRAYQFLAESAREEGAFQATLCDSQNAAISGSCNSDIRANMGINIQINVAGPYYLKTASSAPFDLTAHERAAEQKKNE